MIWQGISKVEFWVTKDVRNDLERSSTPCSQFYKSGRKIFLEQCSLKPNNQFCALIPKCKHFDVFSFDFWRQVLLDVVLDSLELSGLEGFHFCLFALVLPLTKCPTEALLYVNIKWGHACDAVCRKKQAERKKMNGENGVPTVLAPLLSQLTSQFRWCEQS